MKNILKYLQYYKKQAILAPIFKWIEAIFDLFVPVIVSLIIDNGILKSNTIYGIKMSGMLVLLAVFGVIVSIIAQYFAAKASVGLGSKLREKLFEHVQEFSFSNLDEMHESGIINRISNDTWQIQNGVNLLLRLALRSPFIVFGSLIMAILIDRKIGIIFAIAIALILLIIMVITRICVPRYENMQAKKDNILNITKDTLEGARVIRAFGIEEKMEQEFEEENSYYTKLQEKTAKIATLSNPLNYVVVNFGIIGIIAIGGKQVDFGILSQGQIAALYNYMAQILIELVKLTNLLLLFPKTVALAKRINELFSAKNSMKNGRELIRSEKLNLEFKNVYLHYGNGEKDSLTNINFKIQTGETMGIIGGTGSGKTSVINLIPRFYEVSAGAITIGGKNIKDYEINQLRKEIGIVMQNKVLFRGTIKENIEFGSGILDNFAIENALEIAQAKEFVDQKENGIQEIVEENGKNFSGGQKQRLTIARAIAKNPKILILDDSMSALDLMTDKKLREALEHLKQNKILILVSQRISTIKNLDKILVMDNGKIVGQGKHQELLKNCEIYREIYNSQTEMEGKNEK